MGLSQELLAEYEIKKKEILDRYCPNGKGNIPSSAIAEMNVRQCAGSFLALFGMNALKGFDSLPDIVRARYCEKYPEIRDLLSKACVGSLIMNN